MRGEAVAYFNHKIFTFFRGGGESVDVRYIHIYIWSHDSYVVETNGQNWPTQKLVWVGLSLEGMSANLCKCPNALL